MAARTSLARRNSKSSDLSSLNLSVDVCDPWGLDFSILRPESDDLEPTAALWVGA